MGRVLRLYRRSERHYLLPGSQTLYSGLLFAGLNKLRRTATLALVHMGFGQITRLRPFRIDFLCYLETRSRLELLRQTSSPRATTVRCDLCLVACLF